MTEKKESTKADAEEKKVAATKKEAQPSKETSTKGGQESKPTPKTESKPGPKTESKPSDAKKESKPGPKTESKPSDAKKESKPAPKTESKPSDAKKESKPAPKTESKPSDAKKESKPSPTKKGSKPSGAKKESKPSAETKESKPAPKKDEETDEDVTIVEEGEEAEAPVHTPRIKPELDDETRVLLAKRREIDGRRPEFRRQQWFEYKRLSRTGWRKPTGQDSAMRRHFVYRPSVVRIGFRGPAAVRGLHPSGFEEVRVERPQDLEAIDPKKQAARVSGSVGKRKLKDIYKEADKRKIRVLNRRSF